MRKPAHLLITHSKQNATASSSASLETSRPLFPQVFTLWSSSSLSSFPMASFVTIDMSVLRAASSKAAKMSPPDAEALKFNDGSCLDLSAQQASLRSKAYRMHIIKAIDTWRCHTAALLSPSRTHFRTSS